jgi:hypothetical protein
VLVAINQNEYGGLGALWWIARGAIDNLQQGRASDRGFHLRSGWYMAAVLSALDGGLAPDESELDADAAADAWQRSAFLEAVKCSPIGNRSKPDSAMWGNCPPRYTQSSRSSLHAS